MKKYLVFKFYTTSDCMEMAGGWDHFIGDYDDYKEALKAGGACYAYQVVQVVDRDLKAAIFQGDPMKEQE